MSAAFEDYCLSCEKLCEPGQVYCSDACQMQDQDNEPNQPCQSIPKQHQESATTTPHSVVSPLLTPQVNPRKSIVESLLSPKTHASVYKNLSYESPFLSSQNALPVLDLDSNSLDLNVSHSIKDRRSSHASIHKALHHGLGHHHGSAAHAGANYHYNNHLHTTANGLSHSLHSHNINDVLLEHEKHHAHHHPIK